MSEHVFSNGFPAEVQKVLADSLAQAAKIDYSSVQDITQTMGIDVGELMVMLLPTAAAYARVPISKFYVGAVAQGHTTGHLYLGSNMEFSGEALSFSVHAEQSVITNAWLHGEQALQKVAINAAPCGYCRQFLNEISEASETLQVLLKSNDDPNDFGFTQNPLRFYLPEAFGPKDLKIDARLMQTVDHGLRLDNPNPLAAAALAAANASYAPYTNNYSGVAIERSDGAIFAGRYAENAAFNPSMSPLQNALAFFSMNSAPQMDYSISKAALVEAPSIISQRRVTEDVLSVIAPDVKLEHYLAR